METKMNIQTGRAAAPPRRRALPELTADRKIEIEKLALFVPEMRRGLFVRVAKKAAPASQAIRAKCQECVGYEDVLDRVGNCTCGKCPLFAYRPYQPKE